MQTVVPPAPANFRVPIPPPGATTEKVPKPQQNATITSPVAVKNTVSSTAAVPTEAGGYDGKILRKSVMRKTVDYNSSIIKVLESRIWQRDHRDRRALQPDVSYQPEIIPPGDTLDNPINAVTTKFVRTATNKMRCPIFCLAWTPEGRRLITGASSGEFTLWNGLTFNFETILQAHDGPIRTMVWSHDETWMVTGDHHGYAKYWQSNMNNVKMFQAHKEPVRGLRYCHPP